MADNPKIENIVAFSIDYLLDLFSNEKPVEHSELFKVHQRLIEKFHLRDCDSVQCLFRPIYWYFKDNYCVCVYDKDPKSDKFYWSLKNGLPNKEEFKGGVLEDEKIKDYLKIHIEKAQSSS